jgi:hypothetical protein
MQDELSAMPQAASGEEAVEDAKLRQDLGDAEAPISGAGGGGNDRSGATGPALDIRYVGDKAFLCTAGRCTDTAYVPDTMTPEEVAFASQRYDDLLKAHPDWAGYFALAPETIFVTSEGAAYRFTLGDPAAPEPEATSPASAPRRTPTADPQSGICSAPLVILITILALALRRR